jgi:hypothetical protein
MVVNGSRRMDDDASEREPFRPFSRPYMYLDLHSCYPTLGGKQLMGLSWMRSAGRLTPNELLNSLIEIQLSD